MNLDLIFSFFIGAIVGALMTFIITRGELMQSWQADAVAVGHAEYYMDHPNGVRKWRWKGQEK